MSETPETPETVLGRGTDVQADPQDLEPGTDPLPADTADPDQDTPDDLGGTGGLNAGGAG